MTPTLIQHAIDTAIEYVKNAQTLLMTALTEQRYEHDEMFSLKSDVEKDNPSFGFDYLSNELLFKTLTQNNFECNLYSEEEHSWKVIGNKPKYFVICDPFCNSSLAPRTFRDSAVAICIGDLNGQFIGCAIGDLQIRRIYYADPDGAYILEDYDQKKGKARKIHVSDIKTIEEAFIVTPLLKSDRRSKVKTLHFFDKAKIIHGVDGAIMIGRLASGLIDGYLDPTKGQPLYEVPCCEIIIKAGGIVTDNKGRPFQLREIISDLSDNKGKRYKLVAACTSDLHNVLLNSITSTKDE